ncbi:MAG: hypothetical protein Q4G43_01695 [Mobilicoccus sp.]|nr:hypothetical protein [Mobilicoccus sp.]
MSLMERRLQILLDEKRYDRVAAEADRSGRSVAAVVREAIDMRFPDDAGQARAEAARSLLSLTADDGSGAMAQPSGEGPAELKGAYAEALDAKLGR